MIKIKKIIFVLVVGIVGFGGFIISNYLNAHSRNIFDELYNETKATYQQNNILGEIEGLDVDPTWPVDDPNIIYTPFAEYKLEYIPKGYSGVKIRFNFENSAQTLSVFAEKEVMQHVRLLIWARYSYTNKVLIKTVEIVHEKGNTDEYIKDEVVIKEYLKKYQITADNIEHYYNEIMNEKVLYDWISIYGSKFSPENYGDIEIQTQWKDW